MKKRYLRRSIELSLALAFAVLALMACVKLSVFEIWDELVNGSLEISPSFVSLRAGQKVTLSASGGSPVYRFVLVGGGGTLVDGLDGRAEYTAPGSDTEAAIRLTDAAGTESEASVLVKSVPPLTIQPSIASLEYGNTQQFVGSGGLPPYVFSLVSGLGSVTAAGLYTAPASDTVAMVSVEDASGQSSEATVVVSSAPQPLAINPVSLTIETGTTFTFSASGGTPDVTPPPYIFSVSGGGSIVLDTGEYTALSVGSDIVTVSDSVAATATATVTVKAPAVGGPLQIIPATITVKLGSTFQFEAMGGDGSYTFAMKSSYGGDVTQAGLYSAPPAGERPGTEKVLLIDGRDISVIATVKVKK
ncbi:MAG: hypothetical protein CVV51_08240 [Spirochaetae bacterium HGW-Spirochaetae-7]|nr:MAG: hypothetical protein CVV51_08240 [Spirochaetae bacterium HGW-Spirochaetae-7]